MTLSRFLRDYLYIPLGGNRHGHLKRYRNLMLTMLLGGLWHGAGWTFIAWGGLHGLFLIINHGWHAIKRAFGIDNHKNTLLITALSCALTFFSVSIAWVFFRAESFDSAVNILSTMFGMNDNVRTRAHLFSKDKNDIYIWFACLSAIIWLLPNVPEWIRYTSKDEKFKPEPSRSLTRLQPLLFKPSLPWAALSAILATAALLSLTRASEFLYCQF